MRVTVLIDARSPMAFAKVFSIALVERILRQLHELGQKTAIVMLPVHTTPASFLRREFYQRYPMTITWLHDPETTDVIREITAEVKWVVLLEGDGLYDERIVKALCQSPAALWISDAQAINPPLAACVDPHSFGTYSVNDWRNWVQTAVDQGLIETRSVHHMDSYLLSLRRDVTPQLQRVATQEAIRDIENAMYHDTFKGAMELVGAYGYRLPVRGLTRFFARTSVTPNMLTALSVVCKFAAIPFFALGWLWTGLLLAWAFVILDSVDGKLARMTVRYSRLAGRIDQGTTLPAYLGWYLALGWHVSGGNIFTPPGWAGIALAAFALFDKLSMMYFVRMFGRSLLDYEPVDRQIHLFNARKNLLVVLMIGLLFEQTLPVFYMITFWMGLTFLAHLLRVLWVSYAKRAAVFP
jgi:phosphatidylglycerophosphate synthase